MDVKQLEKDINYMFDQYQAQPDAIWCSHEAAIILFIRYGPGVSPEFCAPCGPGFSCQ